jgi:transcriptional regulator with GAF, ATPase, and Fis domain
VVHPHGELTGRSAAIKKVLGLVEQVAPSPVCSRMGKKITQVPRATMDALQRHPWPGNVGELRNVIEHGAIITTGDRPSATGASLLRLFNAAELEHASRIDLRRDLPVLRAVPQESFEIRPPGADRREVHLLDRSELLHAHLSRHP